VSCTGISAGPGHWRCSSFFRGPEISWQCAGRVSQPEWAPSAPFRTPAAGPLAGESGPKSFNPAPCIRFIPSGGARKGRTDACPPIYVKSHQALAGIRGAALDCGWPKKKKKAPIQELLLNMHPGPLCRAKGGGNHDFFAQAVVGAPCFSTFGKVGPSAAPPYHRNPVGILRCKTGMQKKSAAPQGMRPWALSGPLGDLRIGDRGGRGHRGGWEVLRPQPAGGDGGGFHISSCENSFCFKARGSSCGTSHTHLSWLSIFRDQRSASRQALWHFRVRKGP